MKVDLNMIAPSQIFLKPETLRLIFEHIDKGDVENLPPPPLVRKDEVGKLVAIDGHNLLAAMAYLGKELEVCVATSSTDELPDTPANATRNQSLKNTFNESLANHKRVQEEGINSFADLIAKYKYLFPK